jgi:hypothetical protein
MVTEDKVKEQGSRTWFDTLRHGRSGRFRANGVRPYDRFVKVVELLQSARTVWLAWHTVDLPGLPPHVKLIQERPPHRLQTVATSALLDRRFYRRLPPGGAQRLATAPTETESPQDAPRDSVPTADAEMQDADATGTEAASAGAGRGEEHGRIPNLVPFAKPARERETDRLVAEPAHS